MKCLASPHGAHILRGWLTIACAGVCFVGGVVIGITGMPFYPMVWTAVIPLAIWLTLYPERYVNRIRVWVDDDTVSIQTGAWWRHHTIVPIAALRTVELIQTPLGKHFNCVHLILRFAGGLTVLPFVSKEDAHRIGERLY